MDVEINYLAVVLATISSFVVGGIWYAKPVFGTTWAKLAHLDDEKIKKGAVKALGITVVTSLFTAYIIAHVSDISREFFGVSTLESGINTSFWLWLGIVATTVVTHDVFEQRPAKLTALTLGNSFVTLLLMGAIIGALGGF